jgi:cobalt-zinc-cadmium efflux system outer membrane protein
VRIAKRTRRVCTLLSTLLAYTSCAHYVAKPLDPERSRRTFEARSFNDPTLLRIVREHAPDPAQPAAWGRAQLLVAALALNPKAQEARATLAQSGAAVRTAGELQNPSVTLSSEYDLSRAAESPWLWGLAMSFLADTFVSHGTRVDLARANARGAEADFAEALWGIRRDLRSALLAFSISERRVRLLAVEVERREQLQRLAVARVAAGESARPEALQTDLELARSVAALDDARGALAATRGKLASALGLPVAALTAVNVEFEEIETLGPVPEQRLSDLRDRALLARADLARAIADYDAKELELKQQMGARYLQFSLGPGYTYDHGVRKLTFGASLALPVFNRNGGPIAEALAARESAGRHAESVQASILNEIDSAREAFATALAALERTRGRRVTSEAASHSVRHQLDVGAADRPTLLAAEVIAGTERLAELDALDRAQQALGSLEDAVHAPISGPELNVGSFDAVTLSSSEAR